MPPVEPFVGLLYDRTRVGSIDAVSAPPYDVISDEEGRRLRASSPFNVVRILLGDESPTDPGPEGKYRVAADEFRRWREGGILVPTDGPSLFPYEMTFRLDGEDRSVRGLVCAVPLEGDEGKIRPHEGTMPGPIEDRLQLTRSVRANLSCILAVLRGPNATLAGYLRAATDGPPAAETVDEQGVRHRLWVRPPEPQVSRALAHEDLVIADGHHRFDMYLRYRDEMRERRGPGPWDRVMMLVVDAATEGPPVLPYHRVLRSGDVRLEGVPVGDLEALLGLLDDAELRYGSVAREEGRLVHRVAQMAGRPPTVLALHRTVLDERTPDLTYTPDPTLAEALVREGDAVAAFLLPRTSAATIHDVVDRGERLPPKSTFFWPKPRTGLVIRPLDVSEGTVSSPRPAPRAS